MNELVSKLIEGEHPVTVARASGSASELKGMIDRDYVLIKFTQTRGGTELGYRLDKARCKLDEVDWETGQGTVTLVGNLNLDYTDVRCIAVIDASSLEGSGHLQVLES